MELTPEASAAASHRYRKITYSPEQLDALLVDIFLEAHRAPPAQIVLDLDATDIPLYGHQPERFFHGYYDSYCYLPLYIFAGDQLLSARLRPANQDAAAGAVEEVRRIVTQLRERWPEVKIVLRADSGLCREELMSWCEQNRVDSLFGLARNQRLAKIIGAQMHQAHMLHQTSGQPARVFAEFSYKTRKSWSCARRVVAKAEYLDKGENPRFVVPSLTAQQWAAQDLYEKFYCARGEMENRIKEQMCLFADRLSTDEMKGNQLRLYFSALAYTLIEALRRLGLKDTVWGRSAGGYDPPEAAQNRRYRAGECSTHCAPDEFSLPLEKYLRPSLPDPALLSFSVAHTNSHSASMHNPFPSIPHRGRSYTQTKHSDLSKCA